MSRLNMQLLCIHTGTHGKQNEGWMCFNRSPWDINAESGFIRVLGNVVAIGVVAEGECAARVGWSSRVS